jgi:L-iditol 2-dehydrogenase
MWAYRVCAPGRLERVEVPVPEPGPDRVLVRLHAGGICGSDLPSFRGRRNTFVDFLGEPGYPLHEVVGEVVSSNAGALAVGDRVVGWAEGHRGLAEYFVARADNLLAIDGELTAAEATVIQPLCTVLHALNRLPEVEGRRAAVIGQGPIGLLFSHALKARGAAWVTGVDRVDRRDMAATFGVDEPVWDDGAEWATRLEREFDIVVEAVGHHAATVEAAVDAAAPFGTVLAFGVPDESHYAFPFKAFFRKHLTLLAGAAEDRHNSLVVARDYLREHHALLAPYITEVLPVEQAQEAFDRAVRPAPWQGKIVMTV